MTWGKAWFEGDSEAERCEQVGCRSSRRVGRVPLLVLVLICSCFLGIYPVESAFGGQTTSPGIAIQVSDSTATGVALASAAQNRVLSDAQWKDYEDVIVIATLNGVSKMAANNGQAMTSADYGNITTLVRTQLDANTPSAAQFQNQDEAARLRYGIDSLSSLAVSTQAGTLLPKVIFGLEKAKLTQLETALDPSRQTPADLAPYTVNSSALQFVADQVQQVSDLAQNDSQFAAAVNPILTGLTKFDTTSSYAQIQASYALPTLAVLNSDGSYTLNKLDLVSQYQSVLGNASSGVDSALAKLEGKQSSSPPATCSDGKPADQAKGGCAGATCRALLQQFPSWWDLPTPNWLRKLPRLELQRFKQDKP